MTTSRLSLHPDSQRLETRLIALRGDASPLGLNGYRSTTPQYATEADLIGQGSRHFGGRWNPPGVRVVYASFSAETAMAEALATARYYGFPVQHVMPRTFVAVSFKLQRVLDLTHGKSRKKLGISRRRLLETDWRAENAAEREAITQAVGRLAAAAGIEALTVHSATPAGGQNIVVFPDVILARSEITVFEPGRL